MQPILVSDIRKILRFVDAEIVHEDVSLWHLRDEFVGSFCRAKIRFDAVRLTRERGDRLVYLLNVASRNGYLDPFFSQHASDRETDPRRATGDDRSLAFQLQVYSELSLVVGFWLLVGCDFNWLRRIDLDQRTVAQSVGRIRHKAGAWLQTGSDLDGFAKVAT